MGRPPRAGPGSDVFPQTSREALYTHAKTPTFPRSYYFVRGDRAISADTAIRLGKYFGLPAQFWLNLQNDYDLRIAADSGIGKEIKPRNVGHRAELTAAR